MPQPIDQILNKVRNAPAALNRGSRTLIVLVVAVVALFVVYGSRSPERPGRTATRPAPAFRAPDPTAIDAFGARTSDEALDRSRRELELRQRLLEELAPIQPATRAPRDGARRPTREELFEAEIAALEMKGLAAKQTVFGGASGTNIAAPRIEPPAVPTTAADRQEDVAKTASKNDQDEYRLEEGTVLEAVLGQRINASFAGPVSAWTTADVYSRDRQRLLVPKGSRFLGRVRAVESYGETRVAVAFHRLNLPNGDFVSFEDLPGLSQVGETGLRDKVDRHMASTMGAALALGAIAGLSLQGTSAGYDRTGADAYRQGVTTSVGRSTERIVEQSLIRPPTHIVREGQRIRLNLTRDLWLREYDPSRAAETFVRGGN